MRELIDLLSGFVSWARRKRRIRVPPGVVKVNVGSGMKVVPGWIHVDGSLNALCSNWPAAVLKLLYRLTNVKQWYTEEEYLQILKHHRFIHHDVSYGLPFVDESVDYLYSSHLLEHLSAAKAQHLLGDAFRVLKPGGQVRICVPDLEYAIDLYQKGEKHNALDILYPSHAGRQSLHQFMYDFELLRAALTKAGFHSIERCGYRQGRTPDIDKLDNRPEQTLYVEAVK
ncbi:MAG TPA: methyltransferase domain-containing protein [Verrucomicrobiae bacterium]|nr:methyltransferase domain-containing protein [Verrucomicrobiae bacterium]